MMNRKKLIMAIAIPIAVFFCVAAGVFAGTRSNLFGSLLQERSTLKDADSAEIIACTADGTEVTRDEAELRLKWEQYYSPESDLTLRGAAEEVMIEKLIAAEAEKGGYALTDEELASMRENREENYQNLVENPEGDAEELGVTVEDIVDYLTETEVSYELASRYYTGIIADYQNGTLKTDDEEVLSLLETITNSAPEETDYDAIEALFDAADRVLLEEAGYTFYGE